MIDRAKFFAAVRASAFGGAMTRGQEAGCAAILDGWEARGEFTDLRWLAYMLATTKWETAHTMQPIEEYGRGAGRSYGRPDPETGQTYYGRGYVQLTWKSNYQRMAALLGVDLVNRPELALDPRIAAEIMFTGMRDGLFTGVGLPRYFNATTDDPVEARRVINGTDRAHEIAAIHRAFLAALQAPQAAPSPPLLMIGVRHPDVVRLRELLAPPPDLFDLELDARVREYQRRHGLTVDGKVGKDTRAALGM